MSDEEKEAIKKLLDKNPEEIVSIIKEYIN